DPRLNEFFKSRKTELDKLLATLDEEIKKRRDSYGLRAATKKGLEKFAIAMDFGLANEAVDVLKNLTGGSPEEEKARGFRLIELLLMMGGANYVSGDLSDPIFGELRAYRAAALGHYAELDVELAGLEMSRRAARAVALAQEVTLH